MIKYQSVPVITVFCAHSSSVERCPDKTEAHGSIPCARTYGSLAQLVERRFYTADVRGSSPLGSTEFAEVSRFRIHSSGLTSSKPLLVALARPGLTSPLGSTEFAEVSRFRIHSSGLTSSKPLLVALARPGLTSPLGSTEFAVIRNDIFLQSPTVISLYSRFIQFLFDSHKNHSTTLCKS